MLSRANADVHAGDATVGQAREGLRIDAGRVPLLAVFKTEKEFMDG